MMDERELILGEAEQEQKEALLPKAILTPPWEQKNNHGRQQKKNHLPAHLEFISGLSGGPRPNCTFGYSLSHTPSSGRLLTDADGKAIFYKVRVKREQEKIAKQTKKKAEASAGKDTTGSGLREKQSQIKILDI